MAILGSILKFSFFTFFSKISGFLRDIALASVLGVSAVSDIFFIAFRLPNLFRAILADGAFNVVFTPIFSHKCESDKKGSGIFLNNIFTILVFTTGAFCIIGELIMPLLVLIFAPGLDVDSAIFARCVEASRVMFPYLLCVSLCAMLCGVLQTSGKFAFAALNPIILNLFIIFAAGSYLKWGDPVMVISSAVLFAGVTQLVLAWLLTWWQSGYFVRFTIPQNDDDVKLLTNRFFPAALGACATRLSIWIDTVIASIIPKAVSYLYYADRIYQLPRSLVGVAISYVMLPELSRAIKKGDQTLALYLLNRSLELGYILCIPAAVALALLAERLSAIFFVHGVDIEDINCISRAIILFSFTIPSVTMLTIINTMFFASGDTKTPVRISFFCIGINAILNLFLIHSLGYMSVPIATSIGSWLNTGMLTYKMRTNFGFKMDQRLTSKLSMTCVATCIMAFAICAAELLLMPFMSHLTKLVVLLILCLVGFLSYVAALFYTGTYSKQEVLDIFKPVRLLY